MNSATRRLDQGMTEPVNEVAFGFFGVNGAIGDCGHVDGAAYYTKPAEPDELQRVLNGSE
jgi:hypothetical protein